MQLNHSVVHVRRIDVSFTATGVEHRLYGGGKNFTIVIFAAKQSET